MRSRTVTMKTSGLRQYPPFYIWLIAAFVSAFLLGLLYWYIQDVEYRFSEFDRHNTERLALFLETDSDLKVILVGDSRVRYGIDPSAFAEEVEEKLQLKTTAMTLTANRGTWNRLRQPLAILQSDATNLIVLIDDNMFAKEWTWLHDFRHKWDFAIWSVRGQGNWRRDGNRASQIELQSDLRCEGWLFTEETPEARTKRVSQYFAIAPDGKNAQSVQEFVRTLLERETRVATVYIPPQPGGEPMVWRRPVDELTLAVDFSPKPDSYCDSVHLNETGREEFSLSLAQSVVEWLQ